MAKSSGRKHAAKGRDDTFKLANVVFLATIVLIAVGGFVYVVVSPEDQASTPLNDADMAAKICIAKCEDFLLSGEDPSRSTCLMNPISGYPDWVCDIVHSPRAQVDNDQRNQCSTYVSGAAKHFVEVSTKCELLKIV